ncbi:hypothetical protein IQ238_25240 [Pleurocapsales cyanobacterium LEGE 06147]|nr:hypothetical protein [Pleurocapsales cyanobacterium LEGE 06147]
MTVSSCRNTATTTIAKATETSSGECPSEPTATLNTKNVKSLDLDNKITTVSGKVSSNTQVGYAFTAQSGQKFQYQTDEELCIWLYSPDNQIIDSTELPVTGKYTLQIGVPKGSKSFDLTIGLLSEEQEKQTESIVRTEESFSPPKNPRRQTSNQALEQTFIFNPEDFPQYACGDSKPTDPSDYPVEFYPVNVPYSEDNLYIAQSYFCQDAFQKRAKDTREKEVQIASFTNEEKARAFAEFVYTQIPEVRVGSPTVVYE